MAAYPSEQDALSAAPLIEWIDRHFLRHDPFAFPSSDAFLEFRLSATRALDVEAYGVFCIGSGAIGLSLNPRKMDGGKLKVWDELSDLDVAVVSRTHFDQAWKDISHVAQPWTQHEMQELVVSNLRWQRKRLFDGAILAKVLMPALSFGPIWLPALTRLNQFYVELTGREREMNIWIYRDYWSLRNYVAVGLDRCQKVAA